MGAWDSKLRSSSGDAQVKSFFAELSTSNQTAHERAAERINVSMNAALRQRGASGVSVQIGDLSIKGFRATTHLELQPGTDVWLRMPGIEPVHARAVWARGHQVGCEFIRPLHPAVLDMIVRNSGK
jgi:hypothetical protein